MLKKKERDAFVSDEESTTSIARSERATTVTIYPEATWTNDTFRVQVCANFASETTSLSVSAGSTPPSMRFVLPDCVYSSSASLIRISLYKTILMGDPTFPDPFARLSNVLNGLIMMNVIISNSAFVPYDTSQYRPNWDQIWLKFPSLPSLVFEDCGIYGTLPQTIPSSFTTFTLHGNHISGTIPSSLLEDYASLTSTAQKRFTWAFARNELSGIIPGNLLRTIPGYTSFSLSLDQNLLTGVIPSTFLYMTQSSTLTGVDISFGNNLFVDTVPSDLWGLPNYLPALTSLSIMATNLDLSGALPTNWVQQYSFPNLDSFTLILSRCRLTGTIGNGILPLTASALTSLNLNLDSNPLNTAVAPNFFQTVVDGVGYRTSDTPSVLLGFSNCGIPGSLLIPSMPNSGPVPNLSLVMANNTLGSISVPASSSSYIWWLDLSDNPVLYGNVENLFVSPTSILSVLDLSRTGVSGNIPDMASMTTTRLVLMRLDETAIVFCFNETNRSPWVSSTLSECSLRGTSASRCSYLYPSQCLMDTIPTAPEIAPNFEIPETAIPPIAPPTPTPVECRGTRPSEQFKCINGVWTSTSTVTAPTLVISPGTLEVVVDGNVTSGTVVLQGIGSSITVTGCFTNLSVVTIQLTPEDLKKLGSHSEVQLLRSSGNCSDYSTVAVGTTVTGSSCRTVKVDKVTTSNGSLNGVFSVSSSGCNLWWIILVSVLAVLTISGVIVLLVVLYLRKKALRTSAKAAIHG